MWRSRARRYTPGDAIACFTPSGAVRNIATFYDQVTSGRRDYSTIAPSVRSNLTTLLGRAAAYKQTECAWDELMRSEERLDPRLAGLKE